MAIQNRRGVYNDFTPSKMVPGEFAVVQSGDPNGSSGKAVYIAFTAGDVKRLATYEDIASDIEEATSEIAESLVAQIEADVADDLEAAQQAASDASDYKDAASDSASAASTSATNAANAVKNSVAPAFSTSTAYAIGDYVVYENQLYRFTSAHSAGAWNSSHVTATTVSEDLEDFNDELSNTKADLNALSDSKETSYITPGLNKSQDGIVASWETDGRLKIYGTSDKTRRLLCLNGQNQMATSSTSFSKTIDAGLYNLYTEITGHLSQNVSWQYTYTTFANMVISVSKNEPRMTVNLTNDAMVGLSFATGVDFGTSDDPTYISFSAKKIFLKDAVLFVPQSLESNQQDQTRSNIDAVGNDTLYRYNFFDALKLASSSGDTYNGITYTKNSNGTWTIDGTADGLSFRNLINSTNVIPRFIIPGRKYKFLFHGGTIPIRFFIYKNGSIDSAETYTEDFEVTIPEDIGGIIVRFQIDDETVVNNVTVNYEFVPETVTSIDNSYTYNTTVNKTEQIYNNTFNQTVSPTITTDTNGWLQAVDTSESADESGKTDMAPAIMAMLNSTGYCHLGEGVFYVSGNIDMPVNSTLCGCGRKTVVRLLASVSSGYCVKMQSYNTVSNILFRGASSVDVSGNEGTRTAILFAANHDGQEGETAYDSQACMINNVWIEKFSGSGLKCHNTSINVSKGLYAVNLYIANCWAGINIDYVSEFNKFTNVCTYSCKYGCINNSGNNVFTACTFHATQVGFYVDGTQPNSAHGQINGCTFCHIGSNTGSAITIENATNGFVINDCQIWYCSVDITNSDGIIFSGCEFGRGPIYPDASSDIGAKINITGGNLVMFTGCVFLKDSSYPPSITIINNTKTKFDSCYGGDTGNAIAA